MRSIAGRFGADAAAVARIVADSAEASWSPTY